MESQEPKKINLTGEKFSLVEVTKASWGQCGHHVMARCFYFVLCPFALPRLQRKLAMPPDPDLWSMIWHPEMIQGYKGQAAGAAEAESSGDPESRFPQPPEPHQLFRDTRLPTIYDVATFSIQLLNKKMISEAWRTCGAFRTNTLVIPSLL